MIQKPEPLEGHHILEEFECGYSSLDNWLQKKAIRNRLAASQTFVVTDEQRVVGYYCLAAGSVLHKNAGGALKRNMPNPIPVIVLGRLAVDNAYKGQNIGRGLLQDALLRANNVQKNIGARALIVHALDEAARGFYSKFGFRDFPNDHLSLFMPLNTRRLYLLRFKPIIKQISPKIVHLKNHHAARNGNVSARAMASALKYVSV